MTALTLTETLSREITSCARHLVDDDAQVDAHHLLDQRHEQHQARPLGAGIAPEREDDAALVLAQDPDREPKMSSGEDDDDDDGAQR